MSMSLGSLIRCGLLAAVLWMVGLFCDHPTAAGAPPLARPLLRGAAAAVREAASLGSQHPYVALIVVGAIALVWAASTVMRLGQKTTDPVRMYSADLRRACFERAGNRCEQAVWVIARCPRPAAHADHWFPHSKGGATTLENGVAMCARHNTSKGARVPALGETLRLEWRRRRYFPAGEDTRVGQKF